MNERPVGRLLHQTIGTREPYMNSAIGTPRTSIVGGITLATPRTSTKGLGVNGLIREAHQRQHMVPTETAPSVYYESNGGERQGVNKGKQNKKRSKKKKRQPKKNYRNKK